MACRCQRGLGRKYERPYTKRMDEESKLEEYLKTNRRSKILFAGIFATGLVLASLYSAYLDRQVAIRSHNLDVFYKSLTCDDLPIQGDSSVDACEQAIGRFIIEETGLFSI